MLFCAVLHFSCRCVKGRPRYSQGIKTSRGGRDIIGLLYMRLAMTLGEVWSIKGRWCTVKGNALRIHSEGILIYLERSA